MAPPQRGCHHSGSLPSKATVINGQWSLPLKIKLADLHKAARIKTCGKGNEEDNLRLNMFKLNSILAMGSNLLAMGSNLLAMASNLIAMAFNLIAMTSNPIAMALAQVFIQPSGGRRFYLLPAILLLPAFTIPSRPTKKCGGGSGLLMENSTFLL